jgi:hypothetical protein
MNALSAIRTRAKAIRKRHPKMKYQTALKKAGSEYRNGKIKKWTEKKKSTSTTRSSHRTGSGRMIGSIAKSKSDYKKQVKAQLGWLLATQRTAKTKREKKSLQPKISELTRQLKVLS